MAAAKKRVIKSLDNLSEELKDLLKKLYPNGYEQSITRIKNAKNEPIFVFPMETEDAVYLVKVPATKNSDGEYDVESNPETEFENSNESSGNDEEYGSEDSFNDVGDDYDEEGGGRKNREASYDPDFDG